MSAKEEAMLEVRMQSYRDGYKEYKEEQCRGNKQRANLSSSQKRGLDSIQKRVASGELVICPTDKSGKWVVTNT